MAHRAQRVRSLGSGVFLLSRINTSTKFQETVVYKKLNAKNLILILNMWFFYSSEMVDREQEKASEGKSIWKIQGFTFGQLWIHNRVLFTSYNTLHLYNGCENFCTYSSLPFHHLARFLMHISRTICTQFPFPCSYCFHIRCLFGASWPSKQPNWLFPVHTHLHIGF